MLCALRLSEQGNRILRYLYPNQLKMQDSAGTASNFRIEYTQATSKCRIQLELETSLGKALIEDNGYSLVEINNAV